MENLPYYVPGIKNLIIIVIIKKHVGANYWTNLYLYRWDTLTTRNRINFHVFEKLKIKFYIFF